MHDARAMILNDLEHLADDALWSIDPEALYEHLTDFGERSGRSEAHTSADTLGAYVQTIEGRDDGRVYSARRVDDLGVVFTTEPVR